MGCAGRFGATAAHETSVLKIELLVAPTSGVKLTGSAVDMSRLASTPILKSAAADAGTAALSKAIAQLTNIVLTLGICRPNTRVRAKAMKYQSCN